MMRLSIPTIKKWRRLSVLAAAALCAFLVTSAAGEAMKAPYL